MMVAAIVILTAFIFIYDLITPHGMSASLLYLIPFTLSGLFARRKFAFAFAGVTTALVIAGYFLASAPRFPMVSEINRTLTILAGWGVLAALIQRKKTIRELASANAMLKAVFECAPVAIIALDPEGMVLDWNRGATEIFGYGPEEITGRFYPLVEEDHDSFEKNMVTLLGGTSIINMELPRSRKGGKVIQTLGSGAPLKDAEGKIIGVLVTFIDLTEKKRAEAEINALNIEIATRKGVEREREDLAAMITHDLKSPLTTIMLYTEMLINNRLEDAGTGLNSIRQNSEKVLGMIEDYLTVYMSHSGRLQLNMMPEEVADILRDLQKDFQPLAEKKGLRLEFAFADSPKAVIDKKQFGRAVSNLIQNAIKYTPSGGNILVTLEAAGRDFTVSVRDTGPGIRTEEKSDIFQKHYRSRMTAGTKGAGLGLAIVKAVAEAHGGEIILQSEPGLGSTFRLTIPLSQDTKKCTPQA